MMPYQHYESMRRRLSKADFRDVTRSFRTIRVTKSEEELDWLGRGAETTDRALQALQRDVAPGIRLRTGRGGLTGFYYLATTPMSRLNDVSRPRSSLLE